MDQRTRKTSPLVYLLALLGIIMLVFFLINVFPPYPSYPLACAGMGGQYLTFYQNLMFFFAAIIFLFAAVLLSETDRKVKERELRLKQEEERELEANGRTLELLENLLEKDELTILKIILENDGITQDLLHFRTGFSQPKISMLVKKLEEKNLIVRERFGKTYRIHLSEWLRVANSDSF